jgi:hypothetical protein
MMSLNPRGRAIAARVEILAERSGRFPVAK